MAKYSANLPCPCGSGSKYKKCCAIYHKGAWAKTALLLMRSRYCAFATDESLYIIHTTHPDNSDYTPKRDEWRASIELFTKETRFLGLEIIEFSDAKEEAFVTFRAKLSSGDLLEKSRFLKVSGRWLYVDGDIYVTNF